MKTISKSTQKNESSKLLGAGLLTAAAASLCCITPVLALISGTTGLASTFSWMEPFRPYLIGITVLVLAFAWYQKLKPKTQEEIDCACDEDEKPSFFKSKTFLGLVTIFSVLMLAFPYYSKIFYPENKKDIVIVSQSDIQTVNFDVKGMTCTSCEEHIKHAVNELEGIVHVEVSYENEKAEVKFDDTKTSKEDIEKAINSTGYKVVNK
ncbi:copper ion binding protein [Gillisia sp. Hel1_33_143]|uniref:mercuric transport protein MerTP n=1 Tax=unclassified Gillisia TaxID=2615025 RepID=UPI00054E1AB2|nr:MULTISPECIES: mercuric transport protein MerTP [unclassified Gillisia]SDR68249.1 copper ion binding protein [Gillisia sp. Hel1_33_143]